MRGGRGRPAHGETAREVPLVVPDLACPGRLICPRPRSGTLAPGLAGIHRGWSKRPGQASRFALSAEVVLERSRPRPVEEATAAAHFALGQHLHLAVEREGRVRHFRAAYRLHPDNWTYKRQAWRLLPAGQAP